MRSRGNIALWVLYDFANSIVSIVFFLYFAQWIVVDRGISDFAYNLTFSISALLLLLTVPLTGLSLDRFLRRIDGIRVTTILTALFYSASALLAVHGHALLSLSFFTLGLYCYLLSFTFYTPLLHDIAEPGKLGAVSGLGIAGNYAGQFAGLVLVLPFAQGTWNFFGGDPRAETLLPAVVAFFILSLPMLLFFREPRKEGAGFTLRRELRSLFFETCSLLRAPSVPLFLASYFLYNDAVFTASTNFPIFLEQVWHLSDTTKTGILLGILVTSALGGWISGMIADRYGHKRTLTVLLFGWMVILPTLALLKHFVLFVIMTTLMGFWLGSNWTVSRSVMSFLAPRGKHNLAFAYFGLAERASSFIGPIVWGLVVSNLEDLGSTRYRISTIVVTCFIIFGLLALRGVRDDRALTGGGAADRI